MKQLIINGRFLTQKMTGVQRYAFEITKALDAMLASGEIDRKRFAITLVCPRSTLYPFALKSIRVRATGLLRGHLWEQVELPLLSGPHLLLNPCGSAPIFKRRQTVTIHDASVAASPQGYSRLFRWWYQVQFWRLAKTAKAIFTDSRFSADELKKYFAVPEHRLFVVYLGHEHIRRIAVAADDTQNHSFGSRPFLLAVSSQNPNKNFAGLAHALKRLPESSFDVVIVGGTNEAVFRSVSADFPNYVKQVGYVTDARLRFLYEKAAAFIFPSTYEGFGLPALEAMACGTAVIASAAASLPEVCGDAALYFDPRNAEEIASTIARIMTDGTLRLDLAKRGAARAQEFTWHKCAQETWRILQPLL